MQLPTNLFKRALRQGNPQIGLWVGLADAYAAELLASAGFDCLVIDAEHAPNDPRSVLAQLQAMAPYPVHPIVRPVRGAVDLIKQYLDIGAQTLIIPMVDTAEQARQVVAATRYQTGGVRGGGRRRNFLRSRGSCGVDGLARQAGRPGRAGRDCSRNRDGQKGG